MGRASGSIALENVAYTIDEDTADPVARVKVVRSGAVFGAVTVQYHVFSFGRGDLDGVISTAATGVVTFPAGSSAPQYFDVRAVDDSTPEDSVVLEVELDVDEWEDMSFGGRDDVGEAGCRAGRGLP